MTEQLLINYNAGFPLARSIDECGPLSYSVKPVHTSVLPGRVECVARLSCGLSALRLLITVHSM